MSLLAGIDHCKSDALIMMDSDLQHPPTLIPEMLKEFEKGYDIVYTIRKDRTEIGFGKRITSRLFYRMINRISEIPISESAADFRLISRRVVETFQKKIRERNQFLRGLFNWVGFKSTGIQFQVGMRRAGKSKYSLGRMMRFGMQGVVSFSKKPLQATIILGFIFATFGLLHAIVMFVLYFFYASLPSGWTTLTILISMFSGVQLISLGIIGEYIGAIFDEVKGRPHYIIQESINIDDE
jgi:polyisoprenyl-phosphate glycosyltransferase